MKASTALQKAETALRTSIESHAKHDLITNSVAKRIKEIIDDDSVFIGMTMEGFFIGHGGDKVSTFAIIDIDFLLKLNKEGLLAELDKAGI